MKILKKLDAILGRISDVCAWISGAALFIMAALIFVNVIMRYIFHSAIKGADEVVTILMVMVVYFAMCKSTRIRAHVRVDFVTNLMPEALRNFVLALTAWACIFVTVNISLQTWQNAAALIRAKNTTQILKLSLAPFYYIISVMSWLLTLEFFADGFKYCLSGIEAIRRKRHPELADANQAEGGDDL